MSKEQDALFFRNFGLILIALTVFGFFAAFMGRHFGAMAHRDQAKSASIEERVAPIGQVNTDPNAVITAIAVDIAPTAATPAASASGAAANNGAPKSGKEVFDSVCFACHAMGVAGAPKFGDKDAWAPRIAEGMDVLYEHAIKGFTGKAGMMPPKGGNIALADAEIKSAVQYMVANSGGPAETSEQTAKAPADQPAETSEQPAKAPADQPAEPAPPPSAATEAAPAAGAAPATDKGKQVYDSVCFACHAVGVAGAPKFGNKDDWAPRIAQGADVLHKHALEGFMGKNGLMPPKGGRTDLPNADIEAAVDYMVGAAR